MGFGKSKKSCDPVLNADQDIPSRTAGCEECEKEGKYRVALWHMHSK